MNRALGGPVLFERLQPSIQVAVGNAKQDFHFTDLLADLVADAHELQSELLIQAGDSFGHGADVRSESLGDHVGVSLDVCDLGSQASDLDPQASEVDPQ